MNNASPAPAALTGCTSLGLSGGQDRVTEYLVDAEIRPDGQVAVTETITYDFGDQPGPGLFREIPVTVEGQDGTRRPVEVGEVEAAGPSGAPDGIRESSVSNGWYTLRVGDTEQPVTGEQTYELSYVLDGAVADDGQGRPELYWNFVGTGWSVPVDAVRVAVDAPGVEEVQCAVGDEDGERDCDHAEAVDGRAEFSDDALSSGEALTAAVRMPPGAAETSEATVSAPPPRWLTGVGAAWLGGFVGAGALVLWARALWDRAQRARTRRTLPSGLHDRLPASVVGFLSASEVLHPRHVLAALMDMEAAGLVVSRPHPQRPGDFVFEPARDPGVRPSESEGVLLGAMFPPDGGPADLDVLAQRLDRETGRALSKALRREGEALGVLAPRRQGLSCLILLAGLAVVLLAPPVLNDLFHLGMEQLTAVGAVLFGLCVLGVLLPSGRTAVGKVVRYDLVKASKSPPGLRPAFMVALAQEPPPPGWNTPPVFHQDPDYRDRWDSVLTPALAPQTQRNPGSSGGVGFSAGGGGGGGGGGRG